jgi:methionine-S-sulfoxide reductase
MIVTMRLMNDGYLAGVGGGFTTAFPKSTRDATSPSFLIHLANTLHGHLNLRSGECAVWGVELAYQRLPGVVGTCVGYTHGQVAAPTYKEVCSARSGHTEAVLVSFDPKVISYQTLLETLFKKIDPTLINQVGNDRGPQYRHGIYPHTPAQRATAEAFIKAQAANYRRPIVTEA